MPVQRFGTRSFLSRRLKAVAAKRDRASPCGTGRKRHIRGTYENASGVCSFSIFAAHGDLPGAAGRLQMKNRGI